MRPRTPLAALSPWRARVVLAGVVALIGWGLAAGAPVPARGATAVAGDDDIAMYARIVARVHAGEGYYAATHDELSRGGYPLRPMFNWRPPLYAWLFGALPSPRAGQALLVALALFAALGGYAAARPWGVAPAAAVALLHAGLFSAAGAAYLSTELWAGVLLALSLAAYARGWRGLGLAAALLALFFRELALVYVLACVVSARDRRERLAWAIGLGAWAAWFALHAARVAPYLAGVAAPPRSWIAFGGLRFLLVTCRANALAFAAPSWLVAALLPLALAGAAALDGELARARLAALGYVLVFCVVGRPFDFYWGLVWLPLAHFGLARAPGALADLVTASRGRAAPS